MSAKPQAVLAETPPIKQPRTTKTITAFVDHPSDWKKTWTETPLEKLMETASWLISHSRSTLSFRKIAVRVINTTESPYLIKKKNTDSWILRGQSGAIEAQQTSAYGKPENDSTRWPLSDYSLEWSPRNEQTRTAKQLVLVSDTWKPWQSWGSHINSNTNPHRITRAERGRKTQSTRRHRIQNESPWAVWLDSYATYSC